MADAGAIRAGRSFVEIYLSDTNLLKGLDAAEKSLMAFGKKVTEVGSGLQSFGKSLISVGLGAAVGIAVASKEFVRFDDALASIRANTNATDDTMTRISKTILELSRTTGQGATSITTVFDELLKAGVELEDVLGGVGKTVTEFSKVAKLGPEEAATVIVDTMTVFKVSAKQAADVLSKAADASSVSLEQVVQSFAQFAVVGEQAGLSIEEVASSIALLGAAGVKSGDAGTAMKSWLSMLSAPTSEGAKIFKKYGINVRDAGKNMLPLAGIVTELKNKLDKLNPQKKSKALKDLFGSDAIRPAVILMEKGAAGLEEFNQKMRDSLPVAQKYSILMDTIQGGLTKLAAGAERASIALGEAFKSSFTKVMSIFAGFLEGLSAFIIKNKELVNSFAPLIAGVIAVGGAFAALGLTLKVVGIGFGVLLTPLSGVMNLLFATIGPAKALGMGLVGALTSLIGPATQLTRILGVGLVTAISLAAKSLGSFLVLLSLPKSTLIMMHWVFMAVIKDFTNFFKGAYTLSKLMAELASTFSFILNPLGLLVLVIGAVVVALALFTNVFQDIWGVIKGFGQGIVNAFQEGLGAIKEFLGSVVTEFMVAWDAITVSFKQALAGIVEAITAGDLPLAWSILWQEAKVIWGEGMLAIRKVWDDWGMALLDVFSGIYHSLTDLWTSLWTGLRSVAISVLYSINTEFISILGGMKKLWLGFFAAISALTQEFMSGGLVSDFSGAMKRIAEKTKDQLEATDAETKGKLVAADDARDEALGKIAEERKASLSGFEEESKARRDASKEAIKARELELQKAKDVLTGLTDKAAALKDKLEGVPGAPEAKKDIPKAVGKGLQDATDKIDTRGTFSAIGAARGLTVGETVSSKMEEMIAQERLANEELKKLNKAAKNGGLKFT